MRLQLAVVVRWKRQCDVMSLGKYPTLFDVLTEKHMYICSQTRVFGKVYTGVFLFN